MSSRIYRMNMLAVVMCGCALIGCGAGTSDSFSVEVTELQSEEARLDSSASSTAESELTAGSESPTGVEPAPGSDADADEKEGTSHPSFYTVATYDEASNPSEDLGQTIARAQDEHKRILLQVGGEWCGWCKLITNYMETNETVRSHLEDHFLLMKVTYPGDNAAEFLKEYPECKGYPHFFVLDQNGEFLNSQGTGELEEGKGYNEDKFMAFLQQWTDG